MEKEQTKDREAATALAEALGNLPLALALAGAYTAQAGLSLSEYLELFRATQREDAPRASDSAEYPAAIATAFEIALRRIEAESRAAADLLTLCAFLAPDEVPLEILKEATEHLPPSLAIVAADSEALSALAAPLQTYSLAKVRGGSFLSLHHFVQAAARDRLSEDDKKKWIEAAVRLMEAAFPFDERDTRTWLTSERLLQHALTAAERARELHVSEESTASLLNRVGIYLWNKAELTKAKVALEQALEIDTAFFGPDHPNVATHLNNLGSILQDQGDLDGARARLERALAIDEKVYGPDHPAVATDLNNLGNVLKNLGDLDGARAHLERALAITEKVHGPDHPDVAIRLSNLGSILQDQGDLDGARARLERALAIDEKVYGPDHPAVATDLNNLGNVLKNLGDLDGARSRLERALDITEKVYGPDHPKVAIRLNNLGSVLKDQGDLDGARTNYERSLRIFREFLGEEHPSTLVVKEHLESLGEHEKEGRES